MGHPQGPWLRAGKWVSLFGVPGLVAISAALTLQASRQTPGHRRS